MAKLSVSRSGNIVALSGFIDETSDLAAALAPGVSALRFRDVAGINSLGARHFMEFVGSWNGRRYEFHDCPVVMMDSFILLPALLGPEENTATITSFFLPFECLPCDTEVSLLFGAKQVACDSGVLSVPAQSCPKCRGQLYLQETAQNYADLFALGALHV